MRHTIAFALLVGLGCGGGTEMPPPADMAVDAAVADQAVDVDQRPAPDQFSSLVLTNVVGTCTGKALLPDTTEVGYLAAARLTPPSYPFIISQVRYTLVGTTTDSHCDSDLPHRIEIFADNALAPPATPTLLAGIDVPAGTVGATKLRDVTVDVSPPVVVQSPQQLYVALKVAQGTGTFTCLETCIGGQEDRNYWSQAAATPYNWATFFSLNADLTLRLAAVGK